MVSIDDMNKFEQKRMKKIRTIKNTQYDWLINYISEPIKKLQVLQNINLLVFLINKSKQTVYGEERNQASQKHKTNF